MNTNIELKQRIKKMRIEKGESQSFVAKAINTTQQRYSRLESEKIIVTPEDIVLLAKHFQVSCDYLLTGIEEKNKTIALELGLENSTIERLKSGCFNCFELRKAVNGIAKFNLEEITDFILDYIQMEVIGSPASWIDSFKVTGIENDAILNDEEIFESAVLHCIEKMIVNKRDSMKEGENK